MANRHRVGAQVEADPARAFRALAPKLSKAARKKNPAQAEKILAALARHGDALPVKWRTLLVELADEAPFNERAAVGLAQVEPHRSMVPPMIRRVAARLDACAARDDGRSWDDEIGLAVLAKCADRRAAPVLARLLAAPKVAHWDLLLAACLRCGAPELIPAVTRWLAAAKKRGVSPAWDGFAEGKQVLRELKAKNR